jgi:methylenetetrahydrofolate reductase (NADPH)
LDWPGLAREVQYGPKHTFYVYGRDSRSGLNIDELESGYGRSLTQSSRRRARGRVPISYKLNRFTHGVAFTPRTRGYRAATRFYEAAVKSSLSPRLHAMEYAVKALLFECRDCGDCSLPDIAYLCPESQCPKGQRNGPCGGSHDGDCEVLARPCVWVRAYDRLKPYGEELSMLDRAVVTVDSALRGTSAWANTFLGRDHHGSDVLAATVATDSVFLPEAARAASEPSDAKSSDPSRIPKAPW